MNKTYDKSHLMIQTLNDKNEHFILIQLLKIQ